MDVSPKKSRFQFKMAWNDLRINRNMRTFSQQIAQSSRNFRTKIAHISPEFELKSAEFWIRKGDVSLNSTENDLKSAEFWTEIPWFPVISCDFELKTSRMHGVILQESHLLSLWYD